MPSSTGKANGYTFFRTTDNHIFIINNETWFDIGAAAAGRGITSITGPTTVDLEDTYTIHYSDGTTSTYVVTNGARGPQGVQGLTGRGIEGITASYTPGLDPSRMTTITVNYDDHQNPQTFNVGWGRDGVTPTLSIDSSTKHWIINGVDTGIVAEGQDGHSPVITIDQTSYHWLIDGVDTGVDARGIEGPQGPTGPIGPAGQDGDDGRGITSIAKTSSSGLTDTYTITYSDGTTSTYTVDNGADGQDGQDGADGQDGQDGISPHIDPTTGH